MPLLFTVKVFGDAFTTKFLLVDAVRLNDLQIMIDDFRNISTNLTLSLTLDTDRGSRWNGDTSSSSDSNVTQLLLDDFWNDTEGSDGGCGH